MDQAIHHLAASLNVSEQQAAALMLKAKQAMWKSLSEGYAVDLGFAYMKPSIGRSRRRHDFTLGKTVVTPPTKKIDTMLPPVIKQALLSETSELPTEVWMSRGQLKRHLRENGEVGSAAYYHIKGVTV